MNNLLKTALCGLLLTLVACVQPAPEKTITKTTTIITPNAAGTTISQTETTGATNTIATTSKTGTVAPRTIVTPPAVQQNTTRISSSRTSGAVSLVDNPVSEINTCQLNYYEHLLGQDIRTVDAATLPKTYKVLSGPNPRKPSPINRRRLLLFIDANKTILDMKCR